MTRAPGGGGQENDDNLSMQARKMCSKMFMASSCSVLACYQNHKFENPVHGQSSESSDSRAQH